MTALIALVVLFFAQPSSTRAARWAIVAPPGERITKLGYPLSEYESGVATMEHAVVEDSEAGEDARLLGAAVLFWLACSPVLPMKPRSINRRKEPGRVDRAAAGV